MRFPIQIYFLFSYKISIPIYSILILKNPANNKYEERRLETPWKPMLQLSAGPLKFQFRTIFELKIELKT